MCIMLILAFLIIGFFEYQSYERKIYIQKRQWAREDREIQVQFERQQMDLALARLNETPFCLRIQKHE